MTISFTFNVANNIGKVRSFIQDIEVGALLNRVITSHNGKTLTFSGASFTENEFVGYNIFPDAASANAYTILSNTVSTITIRGDLTNSVASSGTSAIISEALFTDDEITQFLTTGNIYQAAAIGLRAKAAKLTNQAKRYRKSGIGGIDIEKYDIKQIIDLAVSYEEKAKSTPYSSVRSFETGEQLRGDDYESPGLGAFGTDATTYLTS